jgi:uncharacterized membrane protein YfcA
MSEWEAIGLLAAAFVAGAVNAVAGGGSFITFPALLASGYSTKVANITNTVGLFPAYAGGSLGYRRELKGQAGRLLQLSIPNLLGGLAGAAILLSTPESAFDVVVPFLIVFACALMAFQDRISEYTEHHRTAFAESGRMQWPIFVAMFALGVYGGYFGAALGVMTLAVFALLISDSLQRLNALKGMSSMIINSIAVVIFAVSGYVEWAPAAVMAVGGLSGGYFGAGFARRLGTAALRTAVIVVGLAVAAVLFAQLVV